MLHAQVVVEVRKGSGGLREGSAYVMVEVEIEGS
jgi:hypothetical protein